MAFIDSVTLLWFFATIVMVVVSLGLLAYLILMVIKEKRKKILDKQQKKEKQRASRKTYLDEVLFVVGLFGFVIGYLTVNWWLLITGTIIMFFSVYLLHHILLKKKEPKEEKIAEEVKEKKEKQQVKTAAVAAEKKIKIEKQEYSEEIVTVIDHIYDLVMEKGAVGLSKIASQFHIHILMAEKYAKMLSQQGLIDFYFPVIGDPILKKVESKEEKIQKQHNNMLRLILFALVAAAILVAAYFILRKYGYV